MRLIVPLVLGSLLVAAACTSSGSGPSTTTYGSGCPDQLPQSGTPCSAPAPRCEYGEDPKCTRVAFCASSIANGPFTWTITGPDPSCAGNAPACPASFDALANGSPCPMASGQCTYPEGRCACNACQVFVDGGAASSLGGEWKCETWPAPAGCAEPRPLLGTTCAHEGQECAYGSSCCDAVDTGPAETCRDGVWVSEGGGCACGIATCTSSANAFDAGARLAEARAAAPPLARVAPE